MNFILRIIYEFMRDGSSPLLLYYSTSTNSIPSEPAFRIAFNSSAPWYESALSATSPSVITLHTTAE